MLIELSWTMAPLVVASKHGRRALRRGGLEPTRPRRARRAGRRRDAEAAGAPVPGGVPRPGGDPEPRRGGRRARGGQPRRPPPARTDVPGRPGHRSPLGRYLQRLLPGGGRTNRGLVDQLGPPRDPRAARRRSPRRHRERLNRPDLLATREPRVRAWRPRRRWGAAPVRVRP